MAGLRSVLTGGWKTVPNGIVLRTATQGMGLLLLGAVLLPLWGCGNFFQCENKPACPATGTGGSTGGSTNTGDFAYVAYTSTTGTAVITGYNIAAGTLVAINSVNPAFQPIAMRVNAANTRLYVASVPGYTNPGVYEYTIGTDGTLTLANSGSPLVNDVVGAMTTSPDGNYLYTLQSSGLTMTQYSFNATTGALQSDGVLTVPALSCTPAASLPILVPCSIAVSPLENYVVASFGTAGDAVFGYTSTTGITNNGAFSQITAGTSSGDFAGTIDGSNNLYLAQTSTMSVWALTSTGNTSRGTYTYPSGSIPRSPVVDANSAFVYTADVGLGKITGFATGTTTALSLLSGSPYAAPANVAALGIDNTNAYLVGVGYDANAGVQLYSLATTGVLTAVASTGTTTATEYPVFVAMSH